MADLNGDFQGFGEDTGSINALVRFEFNPDESGHQTEGVGDDDGNYGVDFFEKLNTECPQFTVNPAILLPEESSLQSAYEQEDDAPHETDHSSGFFTSVPLFNQIPGDNFLFNAQGYPFYEQGPCFTGTCAEPQTLTAHGMGSAFMIDPQLDNSGRHEHNNFKDFVEIIDSNMFIPAGSNGDIQEAIVLAAPIERLPPEDSLTSSSPIAVTRRKQKGKLSFKPTKHVNPFDNTKSKVTKSRGKGKGKATPAKKRRQSRRPLTEASANFLGSDLDDDIDLEKIAGPGKGSLSLHDEFTRCVELPAATEEPTNPEYHDRDRHFDSDATIDLDELTAACHSGAEAIGSYLSQIDITFEDNELYNQDASLTTASDIQEIDSSLTQGSGTELSNGAATLKPAVPAKRGRGRPIVPGSKRQQRIQAMAQPDYVPPKRGRPRTSDRQQRKRIRRAKTNQVAAAPQAAPALPMPQPEDQYISETQYIPEAFSIDDDDDDLSLYQVPYTPANLSNEMIYTPDQYILSRAQAQKIQHIYEVLPLTNEWAETADRWRLTFNLNRITPNGHVLYHNLQELAENAPTKFFIDTLKENIEPGEGPIRVNDSPANNIQPVLEDGIPFSDMQPASEKMFPYHHLKLMAAEGIPQEMTLQQILSKLLDERDVYFRAIVWEILQGGDRIQSMEFVGSWNRMSGVWDFV